MKSIRIILVSTFVISLCAELLGTINLPGNPFVRDAEATTWGYINRETPTGPTTEYPTVRWGENNQ